MIKFRHLILRISMGCDVGCPYIGRYFDDNWGIFTRSNRTRVDEVFKEVIKQIEEKNHVIIKRENFQLNKIAARWPAKAVAQFFTFSKKGSCFFS